LKDIAMKSNDDSMNIMSKALSGVLKKYGVHRELEIGSNRIDFGNPFAKSSDSDQAENDNDDTDAEEHLNLLVDLFQNVPNIIRELGKKFTELVRQQSSSGISAADIVDRFQRYLIADGLSEAAAQETASRLGSFVSKEMPELGVLAAVDTLRRQHRAEELVLPEKKYVARRKEEIGGKAVVDETYPFEFLENYYGGAIREGRLSAGRLQEIDHALYQALWLSLKREGQGRAVRDLLNPLARDYLGRAQACAAILGIESPEEAGRFFGMRPERIAAAQRGGR
jgi:hypothetical protein